MRRILSVVALVIGAVLTRLLLPDYLLPNIRSFTFHRSRYFQAGDVVVALVPLNIVLFWMLIAAAIIVAAFTGLRRRARF